MRAKHGWGLGWLLAALVICAPAEAAPVGGSSGLIGSRLKEPLDGVMQVEALLKPIRKMTRIKLIKMLIKQFRRVAKDERKLLAKQAANTAKNGTQPVASVAGKANKVARLQQKQMALLREQLALQAQSAQLPVYADYTPVEPVYSFGAIGAAPPADVASSVVGTYAGYPPAVAQGPVIRLSLPLGQLSQLPVYVHDQLRTPVGQQLVRQLLDQQYLAIRRSGEPATVGRRWRAFLRQIGGGLHRRLTGLHRRRGADDEADDEEPFSGRLDMEAIQEGMTRILGGFVGDLVGIVVEEILQKKGEIIANGVRLMVGDLATLFLTKSNLALELTLKNLTKFLFIK